MIKLGGLHDWPDPPKAVERWERSFAEAAEGFTEAQLRLVLKLYREKTPYIHCRGYVEFLADTRTEDVPDDLICRGMLRGLAAAWRIQELEAVWFPTADTDRRIAEMRSDLEAEVLA